MIYVKTNVQVDTPTLNGRVYPLPLMERAFSEYSKLIERGHAFGPVIEGKINLRDVTFVVRDVKIEGKEIFVGVEPVEGRLTVEILKSGAFVLSPAGMGTTKWVDGVDTVQDDYVLIGFDVVPNEEFKVEP